MSRILSSQNTYIEGERRTGKTSLIVETIAQIKKKQMAYIDLFEVRTVEDIISRILNGISKVSGSFFQSLLKNISALRPTVAMDPINNIPSISITGAAQYKSETLNGIMDLFSGGEFRQAVIVFDEFQDIHNLADAAQVLATMRSKIQFLGSLPFVFCGSIRSGIHSIFTDPESPFFKSALALEVGEIDRQDFGNFLLKKFKKAKLKVSPEMIGRILDWGKGNPGDTQQLCWAVVEAAGRKTNVGEDTLMLALRRIFATEKKGYESSLARLTFIQMKCLRALAKWGGKNTLSKDFIKLSGVTHPTTIRKSLKRLEEIKILFNTGGEYKFVNPFFAHWLIHMNY